MQNPNSKYIVGWYENVNLPDWHISGLRAKIDTGAKTSALHVDNILLLKDSRASFEFSFERNHQTKKIKVTCKIKKKALVRSSHGTEIARLFVETTAVMGPITKKIEISLADRSKMKFQMILGRNALENDFLVDVSKRQALSSKIRRKVKSLS